MRSEDHAQCAGWLGLSRLPFVQARVAWDWKGWACPHPQPFDKYVNCATLGSQPSRKERPISPPNLRLSPETQAPATRDRVQRSREDGSTRFSQHSISTKSGATRFRRLLPADTVALARQTVSRHNVGVSAINTPASPAEPFLARFRNELPMLRRRFGVRKLSILGSYVRGEQHSESDLDVLVEFDRIPSMFGYLKLEETLSKIAGVKVDYSHAHHRPESRGLMMVHPSFDGTTSPNSR